MPDFWSVVKGLIVWQWIPKYLTQTYKLDTSEKEKTSIYIDELQIYIYNHWVRDTHVLPHERFRVQLPFFLLLSLAMAARPESLQGVLYENVGLSLVRSESGPKLVMTIRLQKIKRSGGVSRP